ncbi:MAG: Type restriction-modification system methyltransferase subunit [Herbinix sp.]|jgi:type I restriction enzyme M protein|nr:Type restriction-modification system methyltransferase subunit [Herbinix sp.]
MSFEEYLDNVKKMIDELKAMSQGLGLANTGDEYKIISELFTYKFLNDKLIHDFDNREDKEETFEDFVAFADSQTARIQEEHLISSLFQQQNKSNFHVLFDRALVAISELNKDIYSVETATGKKKPLFEPLASYIRDEDKEVELAKKSINILKKYKFENIYENGWDYFSSIFEYLIKDYNKDSGKYAEYFTPVFAGKIMASILYNDTPVDKVSVYDPAAGSGTLLLSMANEIGVNNCTIYSQDISQKSTQFLRINLILNRLAHSLHNVVEGNTLTNPQHLDGEDLQTFDFIVSNPPFNTDFSADVETLEGDKYDRFFAGIPNIPNKKKDSMSIYQVFLQHILASLNESGKAAIVVPAGFLTAGVGIPKKIRQEIVDNNWLTGVISLPSNIFANTGTNVSIIFIDKAKKDDTVFLMDATKIGTKISLDDGQRTILTNEEINDIIDTFKQKNEKENYSVQVTKTDVQNKNYSFAGGQYFKVEMVQSDISQAEFNEQLEKFQENLAKYFEIGKELEKKITSKLGELKYE